MLKKFNALEMMKNRILTASAFFLLSITSSTIFAQNSFRFSIRALGSKVGEIEVKRTMNNGIENIEIKSSAKANMLVKKIEYNSIMKATYKDGVMLYGSGRNEENGEVENYCTTKKNGTNYEIVADGENRSLSGDIKFSISSLYFNEPKGLTKIYSEVWGQYLDIKDNKDGSYTVILPKGGKTVFYYTDGQMTSFANDSKVGKVKMTRLD